MSAGQRRKICMASLIERNAGQTAVVDSVDKAAPDHSALITTARPSVASSADGIESGSKHPVEHIGSRPRQMFCSVAGF